MHLWPGLSGRRGHAERGRRSESDLPRVREHGRLRRVLRQTRSQRDLARHRVRGGPGGRFSALLQRGESSAHTSPEHARPGRERPLSTGHRRSSHDGGRALGRLHHHRSPCVRDKLHQGGQHHSEQLRPWPRHTGCRSRRCTASRSRIDRTPRRMAPGVRHRHLQRCTDLRAGPVRCHLPSRDSASQYRRAAGYGRLAPARRHPERVVDSERMDQAPPLVRRRRGRVPVRLRRRLQRGVAHPVRAHRSRSPTPA